MAALAVERPSFWRCFTPLFGVGLVGVAALVPTIGGIVERQIATLPNAPR